MKLFLILTGAVLLLIAVWGVVCWITGFEMIRMMLVEGAPVSFEDAGKQWQFPGRLAGVVALAIPILSAIAGAWLLRSGFERGDAHDT